MGDLFLEDQLDNRGGLLAHLRGKAVMINRDALGGGIAHFGDFRGQLPASQVQELLGPGYPLVEGGDDSRGGLNARLKLASGLAELIAQELDFAGSGDQGAALGPRVL